MPDTMTARGDVIPTGEDLVARLRDLMYAPPPWDRRASAADPGPTGRANRTFEWIRDTYLPAVGVELPAERHGTFRWLCNWEPETLANVLETIAAAAGPVPHPSGLTAPVVAVLEEAGIDPAEYVRFECGRDTWTGDVCGCGDDRCADGFHHVGSRPCGCLDAGIERFLREHAAVTL